MMEGFLLVMVGVGFGKIWVLIYWIVYLIEECYVLLWYILVIIFINKVVWEMKEWVVKFLGEVGNDVWVLIFYVLCVWILCCDIEQLGYNWVFMIVDISE